jgi:hypothetical protein
LSRRKPRHQAARSLRDFVLRIAHFPFGKPALAPLPPRVPLTLRVGVAGHLRIPKEDEVSSALAAVFAALRDYAVATNQAFHRRRCGTETDLPPAALRFLSQLAVGVDQAAAEAALACGFALHTVLPGSRAHFEQDVTRLSADVAPYQADPLGRFRRLLGRSERVLELDRDNEADDAARFTDEDYAQASAIILSHSDLVVIVVSRDAGSNAGGTRWLEAKAGDEELPIVRIPMERPRAALLIWTGGDGRRREQALFAADGATIDPTLFRRALDARLLGTGFDPAKTRLR